MKLKILFFLSVQTILISCNAQHNTDINYNLNLSIGDTVKALGNNLMLVYQDKKNNYWFGSWEDGLYCYDGKTILHYTTKSGLPHNRIEEIKEDKSGNVYVNTNKGICMFDGHTFKTLTPSNSNKQWKLTPNDLWFRQGWDSGFVYRYDGNTLYKLQAPKHPKYSNAYAVYSIYNDSEGNVWFGTNPLGVCRYNGTSFDWISELDVTELHDGPANGVRSIVQDKDGYFWFNSMYRYKIYGDSNQKQNFYTREKSIGNLNGKKDGNLNEYLSITKDNNNDLWIATYRDGVWHYDGKNIVHYSVQDGTKVIKLFSIYKDMLGNLWLGTPETGVYRFNGQAFERFNP